MSRNTIKASTAPGILRRGCVLRKRSNWNPEATHIATVSWVGLDEEGCTVVRADGPGGPWATLDPEGLLIDCDEPATCDCVVRYLAENGLDYGWARDIPGALVQAVQLLGRRTMRSNPPLIQGAHGYWVSNVCATVRPTGWLVTFPNRIPCAHGKESGEEGRAAVVAAVKTRYWVVE